MVQSLLLIALISCFQQAGSITDVGCTPYHLIQPVLKRLNARQLATLEEKSPDLTPDTDEVWASLVEKDFPDRPPATKRTLMTSTSEMPNRGLYMQYAHEREQFLESAAQSLRRNTQKLQREKSKNSIVPLHGIIAEPLLRRTFTAPRPARPASKYSNNSIMGKAMKDVKSRLLMFGGLKVKHEPCAAFQTNRPSNPMPPQTQIQSIQKSPLVPNFRNSTLRPWAILQSPLVRLPPTSSSPAPKSGARQDFNAPKQNTRFIDPSDVTLMREIRKRKPQSPLLAPRRKQQRPA